MFHSVLKCIHFYGIVALQVRMNMSQVKMDQELRAKNAEAAAEKNRADELSRLHEDVKYKFNETSLKGE